MERYILADITLYTILYSLRMCVTFSALKSYIILAASRVCIAASLMLIQVVACCLWMQSAHTKNQVHSLGSAHSRENVCPCVWVLFHIILFCYVFFVFFLFFCFAAFHPICCVCPELIRILCFSKHVDKTELKDVDCDIMWLRIAQSTQRKLQV